MLIDYLKNNVQNKLQKMFSNVLVSGGSKK